MVAIRVALNSVQGTGAALGWAGSHTVIADRPEGRAGGTGLGFNGGELLAFAIGGCFCNDLHYMAEDMGLSVTQLSVSVMLELGGEPLLATRAEVSVVCEIAGGEDPSELIAAAKKDSTVGNSVSRGFPVEISLKKEAT